MKTLSVALDALDVSDRLRTVDPEAVKRTANSMGSPVGQITPIEVTHEGGRYRLVSGAHRVAAARQLGWTRIAAIQVEGSLDQLRLHEVEENLMRSELSAYDHAAFMAEWLDLRQRLNLIPKRGGERRKGQTAKLAVWSYEAELAKKFSFSRRTAERSIRRRRAIDDAAWKMISGTGIARKGAHLDALCEVPRDAQRGVVEAFLAPPDRGQRRPSFVELCKVASGLPSKMPASRDRRRTLAAAWDATDAADREWFVAQLPPEDRAALRRLLGGDAA